MHTPTLGIKIFVCGMKSMKFQSMATHGNHYEEKSIASWNSSNFFLAGVSSTLEALHVKCEEG